MKYLIKVTTINKEQAYLADDSNVDSKIKHPWRTRSVNKAKSFNSEQEAQKHINKLNKLYKDMEFSIKPISDLSNMI